LAIKIREFKAAFAEASAMVKSALQRVEQVNAPS
jgi:hypothetical protein